jgi:hypothetical protein
MLFPQKIKNIITEANTEKLYHNLIVQLNKDFQLSNLNEHIEEETSPEQLVEIIGNILKSLITDNYEGYSNFLYRVDVAETDLNKLNYNNLDQLVLQVTYAVLKREYQKVWFKNKL